MATVEEYTDPYVSALTPPPGAGPGICRVCHNASGGAPMVFCESCALTRSQVSHPLDLVVPISLYVGQGQLHTVLRGYKDNVDERARQRLTVRVGGLIARFLRDHGACIQAAAGRPWDTLTIIPSSQQRPLPHPLDEAVRKARAHLPLYHRVLTRSDGVSISHRKANENGYLADKTVSGRSVLLVDDTFTTGARVQSAASALTSAGADVVACVVVGRILRPDFSADVDALWKRQSGLPFDFATCCLE